MADVDPFQPFRDQREHTLQFEGPVVDARLRRVGPPNPDLPGYVEKKSVKAIIDTGATYICIDYRVAHALNLTVTDRRAMRGVTGRRMADICPVWLTVPELDFTERVEAWCGDLGADQGGYALLLGRSFLRSFYFGYDGPRGVFYAIRADELYRPPPEDDG